MSEASALLDLQDLDLRLLRCASQLSKLPQQERIRTIDLARRKVTSELTGIVGKRKDAELEIEETRADLDYYRYKVSDVQADAESGERDHRQLRDLEEQLTSLAKRIEKCEFQLGPQQEQLDRLSLAERNARATVERLDAERAAAEASLAEDSRALRAEIVELSGRRDSVASQLGAETLATYETARKRFGGLAVERLEGNVPSTCRVKLQPSQFHDLAHGDEVTTCPYCHRMLVTTGTVDCQ